jgi:hypothetical protein
MVKTPRTRHSKTVKEPVTIDLSADEVSRIKADEAKTAAEAQPAAASAEPVPNPDAKPDAKPYAAAEEVSAPSDRTPEAEKSPADKPATDKVTDKVESANVKPTTSTSTSSASPASPASSTSAASSSSTARTDFGRKADPVKPSSASTTPTPPPAPKSRAGSGLLAGVAGGVIALLLAGGAQYAGLIPTPMAPAAQQQDLTPTVEQLQAELASLRQQVSTLPTETAAAPEVEGRVAQAEQTVTTLAEQLYAVRDEVAGLSERGEGVSGELVDLSAVEQRIATLETAANEIRQAANNNGDAERIAGLSDQLTAARDMQTATAARIDTLEQTIEDLSARLTEATNQPSTAIIVAASALKAAIDRGSSFTTEIETYASLKPDAEEIAQLRDLAATGVPTEAQLAAEADAAANAMIAATRTTDPNAGITDRLWSSAMGLVQVRPVGMVEGEGVPEIVARLDSAVQAGDLERAIKEFDSLPAAAKTAGEPFMTKVRARAAANQLADQALAAALQN